MSELRKVCQRCDVQVDETVAVSLEGQHSTWLCCLWCAAELRSRSRCTCEYGTAPTTGCPIHSKALQLIAAVHVRARPAAIGEPIEMRAGLPHLQGLPVHGADVEILRPHEGKGRDPRTATWVRGYIGMTSVHDDAEGALAVVHGRGDWVQCGTLRVRRVPATATATATPATDKVDVPSAIDDLDLIYGRMNRDCKDDDVEIAHARLRARLLLPWPFVPSAPSLYSNLTAYQREAIYDLLHAHLGKTRQQVVAAAAAAPTTAPVVLTLYSVRNEILLRLVHRGHQGGRSEWVAPPWGGVLHVGRILIDSVPEEDAGKITPVLPAAAPIPMILHCPDCRARHVDKGAFATKVHHTHSCQSCGLTWRPAVVATVGVQFLPGFKDEKDGENE